MVVVVWGKTISWLRTRGLRILGRQKPSLGFLITPRRLSDFGAVADSQTATSNKPYHLPQVGCQISVVSLIENLRQ
jgi:hypothetical protein